MDSEVLIKRFQQEFRIAQALDHPNIVRSLDFGATLDTGYLVMEFVEGESLGDKLAGGRRMPEAMAILLIAQVAQALHYAHQRGLIHRDVKPDNILITPDGQAKLTDLGLVKHLETTQDLTRTGRALGTPHFMAPEQFRNAKSANVRSDVFSLAATLYRMVTGVLPFQADGPVATFMKMAKNDLIPPRQLVPGLSERVDGVIRKGLSAEPELRPASCREFLDELFGRQTAAPSSALEANLDLWFVAYQDETGKPCSGVGNTDDVRRSLEGGLLGDLDKVRVGRTKSGLHKRPLGLPDFQDVANRTPLPPRPATNALNAPVNPPAPGPAAFEPQAPVIDGMVSCPVDAPTSSPSPPPSTSSFEWYVWLGVIAVAVATGLLAGLFFFWAK
jgi:serine/threonine protein kinase